MQDFKYTEKSLLKSLLRAHLNMQMLFHFKKIFLCPHGWKDWRNRVGGGSLTLTLTTKSFHLIWDHLFCLSGA